MKKAIIYGRGEYYKQYRDRLPSDMDIIAYADSFEESATSVTGKLYEGKSVLLPSELKGIDFDSIIICTDYIADNRIFQTLIENGIPSNKILFLNRMAFGENWSYEATEDKRGIISSIGKVKIKEKYLTDFDIVAEIYAKNTYYLEVPFHDYIVIDMGMNIGAASLYFAQKLEVSKIYGFEPFPDTYAQAIENFARNEKNIRDKIIPHNVALLDVDTVMQVAVPFEQTGWRNIFSSNEEKEQVAINCKKAGEIVQGILNDNVDKRVVLKCDVEGSEFRIFDSLDEYSCFEKIDAIMMEVHGNPEPLTNILKRHQYKFFILGEADRAQMLYAVK